MATATKSKPAPKAKTQSNCTCLTIKSTKADGTIVAGPCGAKVGAKSRFQPGHDARTKGTLQKAFRAGAKIEVGGTAHTAQALAKEFGYERFLTAKPERKRSTPALSFGEVKVGRTWRSVLKATKQGDGFRVTADGGKGKEPVVVELTAEDVESKTR